MSTLWMFYPENDVALAADVANFTPPRNALRLRQAGAFIMHWVASPGDAVIYDPVDPQYEDWLKNTFNLSGEPFDPSRQGHLTTLMPWGWSSASLHTMLSRGLNPLRSPSDDSPNPSETVLSHSDDALNPSDDPLNPFWIPSEGRLMRLRNLSNRRQTIAINKRLHDLGLPSVTDIEEISSEQQLDRLLLGPRRVVKAPWSCSGRGIFDTSNFSHNELKRRVLGVIKKQKNVMSEPWLDKVCDFAMLFKIDRLTCRFIGLSLFNNVRQSAYAGNIVAPQDYLRHQLSKHINPLILNDVSAALEPILSDIYGHDYNGYLGVDMMIYRDLHGKNRLAPCIEVNLRMTMGVIALYLAENHLAKGSIGTFSVTPGPLPSLSHPHSPHSQPLTTPKATHLPASRLSTQPPVIQTDTLIKGCLDANCLSKGSTEANSLIKRHLDANRLIKGCLDAKCLSKGSTEANSLIKRHLDANRLIKGCLDANRLIKGCIPLVAPNPHFNFLFSADPQNL